MKQKRTYFVRTHIDLRPLERPSASKPQSQDAIPSIALLFPKHKKGAKVFYTQFDF